LNINTKDYDIHFNFPGGVPVDGPSAGISMAVAVYSAITGLPVDNKVAMTGEISIHGNLKIVGGITAKLEAAKRAGLKKVIIPKDNWQVQFEGQSVEIVAADRVEEVIEHAILRA
jgi:Lon-like ATP-dependent protease